MQFIFIACSSWGLSKDIETKMQTICFYLLYNFFKKQKGLELVSLPHFLHGSWRKYFSYILLTNCFIVWFPLFCEILSNMCIVIVY